MANKEGNPLWRVALLSLARDETSGLFSELGLQLLFEELNNSFQISFYARFSQ